MGSPPPRSRALAALLLLSAAPGGAGDPAAADLAARQAKDPCACLGQGSVNKASLYTNYPTSQPGQYKDYSSVKWYGAFCAVWDIVPGTPWKDQCPDNADFSKPAKNWCQEPWCYVGPNCATGVNSDVFKGSTFNKYSYKACGAPDCYTGYANAATIPTSFPNSATGCPYDPTGGQTYKIFKSGNCQCSYHGQSLPSTIYNNYPSSNPGEHKNKGFVANYGTTCGAWDQSPETPWYNFCPLGSDWCHQDFNWCQAPWCYVGSGCSSGVASELFKGSTVVFYSYDTCRNTPDCYTNVATDNADWNNIPQGCPYQTTSTNQWYTAHLTCPSGFTGVLNSSNAFRARDVFFKVWLYISACMVTLASRE